MPPKPASAPAKRASSAPARPRSSASSSSPSKRGGVGLAASIVQVPPPTVLHDVFPKRPTSLPLTHMSPRVQLLVHQRDINCKPVLITASLESQLLAIKQRIATHLHSSGVFWSDISVFGIATVRRAPADAPPSFSARHSHADRLASTEPERVAGSLEAIVESDDPLPTASSATDRPLPVVSTVSATATSPARGDRILSTQPYYISRMPDVYSFDFRKVEQQLTAVNPSAVAFHMEDTKRLVDYYPAICRDIARSKQQQQQQTLQLQQQQQQQQQAAQASPPPPPPAKPGSPSSPTAKKQAQQKQLSPPHNSPQFVAVSALTIPVLYEIGYPYSSHQGHSQRTQPFARTVSERPGIRIVGTATTIQQRNPPQRPRSAPPTMHVSGTPAQLRPPASLAPHHSKTLRPSSASVVQTAPPAMASPSAAITLETPVAEPLLPSQHILELPGMSIVIENDAQDTAIVAPQVDMEAPAPAVVPPPLNDLNIDPLLQYDMKEYTSTPAHISNLDSSGNGLRSGTTTLSRLARPTTASGRSSPPPPPPTEEYQPPAVVVANP
ncbi:hypothetical protein RI367_004246 [Sorochytrium milnesiophthora]